MLMRDAGRRGAQRCCNAIRTSRAPISPELSSLPRDGDGDISVYTRHLTRSLRQAHELQVEAFFKRVRAGVIAETRNKQVP